jgi:hypothetical protein
LNVNFEAMNEEIKNIVEATSMGKMEKEAVIKSLLDLHSVSKRLLEIRDKAKINADAWALIHDNKEYQEGVVMGVGYGVDYIVKHFT